MSIPEPMRAVKDVALQKEQFVAAASPTTTSPALGSIRNICRFLARGRVPSKRALAVLAKLRGRTLERSWPYLRKVDHAHINLGFEDVLEFQYARSRSFFVMVVGAYDGIENDPVGKFILEHDCSGIFVEPQPTVFARLRQNLGDRTRFHLVNSAVDRVAGTRELFHVASGVTGLPQWTEQLASFHKTHIAKHEDKVPDLARHISSVMVQTVSFDDLLDQFKVDAIDVLQIDAEGIDALLLSWFPFQRLKPSVVHYEIAHMSAGDLAATRARLGALGYCLYPTESAMDEMAVLV